MAEPHQPAASFLGKFTVLHGALSYVPFLAAKLLIGTFSGALLAMHCPAAGARHSETMWLFVALTATIAPVGLIALRCLIRVLEAGRDK